MFDSPQVSYTAGQTGLTIINGIPYTWEQLMMKRQTEALEAIQKQLAELLTAKAN